MNNRQTLYAVGISTTLAVIACSAVSTSIDAENMVSVLLVIIFMFPVLGVVSVCMGYAYRNCENAILHTCFATAVGILVGSIVMGVMNRFFPYLQPGINIWGLIWYGLYITVSVTLGLVPRGMLRLHEYPVGEE